MLKKLGDLSQTQIFAKIENVEVSIDFFLLYYYVSVTATFPADDVLFNVGTKPL